MRLRHALKIAWTKFKARKARTILSAVITSIMLVVLVALSLGYTGMRKSLSNIDGVSSSKVMGQVSHFDDNVSTDKDDNKQLNHATLNDRQYLLTQAQERYPSYNIINAYLDKTLLDLFMVDYLVSVDGRPLDGTREVRSGANIATTDGIRVTTRSDELLSEFVEQGEEIKLGVDGSIPVLVSPQTLLFLSGKDFTNETVNKRVEHMIALTNDFRSKTLSISVKSDGSIISLNFRVIGFSPNDSLFNSYGQKVITIPTSVLEAKQIQQVDIFYRALNGARGGNFTVTPEIAPVTEEFDTAFGSIKTITPTYEFATKDDLKRFIKDGESCDFNFGVSNCYSVQVIQNALLEFDDQIGYLTNFLRWIVGFFFVITAVFLFFTTSKVIADSRKETGVFRAMGANRSDIAKIYVMYIAIITLAAFVIALVIASVLMSIMTVKQGPDLAVNAASLTGSFAKPVVMSFVGYDILQLFGILCLSLLVGFVGGAIPIIRNVMIDPIKAMRAE